MHLYSLLTFISPRFFPVALYAKGNNALGGIGNA